MAQLNFGTHETPLGEGLKLVKLDRHILGGR